MKALARLLVLLAGLLAATTAIAATAAAIPGGGEPVAIPRLAARVTDLTGTLTAEQRAAMEAELAAFESRKGAQIAVLVLPTTGPEAIEAFGIRLAEAWKIGRKGIDDGVILIVAKDDRRLRIEVGYGLEGVLNDATAKRIVSETITPAFRQGDFAGGIAAGLRAVMAAIEGEALPAPAPGGRGSPGGSGTGDPMAWLFGAAVLAPLLHALLGLLGSLAAAAIGAAAGWWLFGSWIAAGAGAAILFGLSFMRGGPGFMGGGRGGFGGGFSGGGGGFGGGGASGRW